LEHTTLSPDEEQHFIEAIENIIAEPQERIEQRRQGMDTEVVGQ
jgi:hypothetical protein